MYVTRPLSLYRKSPEALLQETPDGPFSGYLIITDEEAEVEDTFCWGTCKKRRVKRLPFPQDKILTLQHPTDYKETIVTKVLFIPVLDQPLSSHLYYVIRAKGKYKGQACVCSKEIDMRMCCFTSTTKDKKPKPFDHTNIYQQIKIHRYHDEKHTFFAKSTASDGFPPTFLKRKGWELQSTRLYRTRLKEALGLNIDLRAQLPNFDFSISMKRSNSIVVGEWYCPFMFIKEECRLRRQMKRYVFYNLRLEQHWEQIYCQDNVNDEENNGVKFSVSVKREVSCVHGVEALKDDEISHGGFYWYRGKRNRNRNNGRKVSSLGLSFAIVERMRWLLEDGGWVYGGCNEVKVDRVEESNCGWRKFGCYVLVESFALRRLDGTLMLETNFKHTNRIRCKWE